MNKFLLVLLTVCGALCATAYATTYGPYPVQPWPLKMTAQPAILQATGSGYDNSWTIERCHAGTWSGGACPHHGENAEWASNWSAFVQCYTSYDDANDIQDYGVHFHAVKGTWPTAADWANHTSVTCSRTEGGNTVSAVVPITTYPDSNGTGTPLAALATLGTTVTLTLTGVEGVEYSFFTPPAGTYTNTTGPTACTRSGTTWPGVTIEVWENGASDILQVRSTWQSRPGGPPPWNGTWSGTCPVTKGGTLFNLPVTVVQN